MVWYGNNNYNEERREKKNTRSLPFLYQTIDQLNRLNSTQLTQSILSLQTPPPIFSPFFHWPHSMAPSTQLNCFLPSLVPRTLPLPSPSSPSSTTATTTHKPLLQRPLLQIPNKVTIIPLTPRSPSRLLRPASPPRHPLTRLRVHARQTVWWRRVVSRARLQTDRLGGIEVARDALDGHGDAALLLLHRRRPLPLAGCSRRLLLGVETRLGHARVVRWGHLDLGYLLLLLLRWLLLLGHALLRVSAAALLGAIWRRRAGVAAAAAGSVDVVVGIQRWGLRVGLLRVLLSGGHGPVRVCGLVRGDRVGLRLLRLLLAERLSLYLLLSSRGW